MKHKVKAHRRDYEKLILCIVSFVQVQAMDAERPDVKEQAAVEPRAGKRRDPYQKYHDYLSQLRSQELTGQKGSVVKREEVGSASREEESGSSMRLADPEVAQSYQLVEANEKEARKIDVQRNLNKGLSDLNLGEQRIVLEYFNRRLADIWASDASDKQKAKDLVFLANDDSVIQNLIRTPNVREYYEQKFKELAPVEFWQERLLVKEMKKWKMKNKAQLGSLLFGFVLFVLFYQYNESHGIHTFD